MPRTSRSAYDEMASRLRVLADLVNDALTDLGTRPVFAAQPLLGGQPALATGPVAVGAGRMQVAVDTTPGPRPGRLRSRASRALQPAPDEHPPSDASSGSTPDTTDVDDDHAEVWSLVRMAQDGNGEAFGLLYDRYVDSVFRFIYYRVNDRALAEDFTSETFVRALRRISTISYQGRDIGAWFVTIARNIVLDHMKSARHRLEVTTSDTIEGRETAESTENAVLTSLDSERLMAAVAQLGDEQRECVMLRFMQGLSVSETAAVMGKNDGAIKALQHRAVRKLADLVGDEI